MNTTLSGMAAGTAALVLAAGASAGEVTWVASGNGFYVAVSSGAPCPPRPVACVTYVPVIVPRPACSWGSGPRPVVVHPIPHRDFRQVVTPPYYGGCAPRMSPPLVCRPSMPPPPRQPWNQGPRYGHHGSHR